MFDFGKTRLKPQGLTLIELVITLAVGAILLSLALPSFSALLQKNRIGTTSSELYSSLGVARSVAIKEQASVTVCPSSNGTSCASSDIDWSGGWIVMNDTTTAVIKHVSMLPEGVDIQSSGTGANKVTFNPTGDARNTIAQFRMCHTSALVKSKQLSVAAVGRISLVERTQTDCNVEEEEA